MRTYQQYCAVAKALDVVGDRWTLLIARELLLRGPSRYTDLQHGLPGIATNLLAERLRELEEAGVVRRHDAAPPVATALYELTPRGRDLMPVLDALGRWGAELMTRPVEGEAFRSHWLAFPVAHLLTDREPDGPGFAIEIRTGDQPMTIEPVDREIRARPATVDDDPDLVLMGEPGPILGMLTGRLSLTEARKRGLRTQGNTKVLHRIGPSARRTAGSPRPRPLGACKPPSVVESWEPKEGRMSETVLPGTAEPGRERSGVRAPVGRPAPPTVAVVLAAGRSERLAGVTGGGSKALVRAGGLALIERAIRTLLSAGVVRVVVVVGYQAGPVAAVASRVAPGRVQTVLAEDWELGNGASLAAAEPSLADEELFVLVTADHVFGGFALRPLLSATRTGVRIRDGLAVAFSKDLDEPTVDCGAFVLSPRVFAAQRRAQARGDASLAAAVTELANDVPVEAIALPEGSWWHDVDTREDLGRATDQLRRSLTKEADGPVSRYLNRPISTRVSMGVAGLPIHPHAVSWLAFALGLVGAVLLARAHGVLGGVIVQLASVVDGVDGEIARLQLRAGPGGALLDGVLDRLADAAIVTGLAVWAIHQGHDPTAILVLAVAALTGALLSMATKDRIAALGIPPAPERWIGFLLGGRDGRLLIVAIAAVLGSPVAALIATTITSGLSLFARLLLVRGDR